MNAIRAGGLLALLVTAAALLSVPACGTQSDAAVKKVTYYYLPG